MCPPATNMRRSLRNCCPDVHSDLLVLLDIIGQYIFVANNDVIYARRVRTASRIAVVLCALQAAAPLRAQAPTVLPPEKLSWYGDTSAPDISGVWIRDGAAGQGHSNSKEGWLPWPPPLKGTFAAAWKKAVTEAAAGKRTDDPIQRCLPPGMPRYMTGTNGPMLIIQTPGRVMLYRDNAPVRRVWLDGRGNPKPEDLEAFSNGNAAGHYVGKDLITEVIGIKLQPIDGTGVPHSDKLKIVERFHRIDTDTLQVDVTLTDADALTRPMSSSVVYKAYRGDAPWEPKEFICVPEKDYHPDYYVH